MACIDRYVLAVDDGRFAIGRQTQMTIGRIVSGGQTGVDRAALDAARAAGVACGGWCPRGRRAEDGAIPAIYPLVETDSDGYCERTRLNVRDSDGTLVLLRGALTGGAAYTARYATALGRPLLVVNLEPRLDLAEAVALIERWGEAHAVGVLNVAGPRESQRPGIAAAARPLMDALCASIRRPV